LIVAEPFGNSLGPDGQGNDVAPPVPFKGAVSSYKINPDGTLETISTSVLNAQTATCWMALTADQRFAYTTNNVSNTISSYKVGFDGSLTLIDPIAADSGQGPVDLAISPDSKFLYNVNTLEGTVSAYEIDRLDGSLTFLGDIGGLPDSGSAVGMAVY
jgi:6-phosphogluconolactonase (cycloisomerase 2 family)